MLNYFVLKNFFSSNHKTSLQVCWTCFSIYREVLGK